MKNTTLCYIEKDGAYLMMQRNKKKNDLNHNKWVGPGGKFEPGETADECVVRETYEETGLRLTDYRFRGIVTFLSDEWEGEYMYLYTATGFEGELPENGLTDFDGGVRYIDKECAEGTLAWVSKSILDKVPMWAGDRLFFEELEKDRGFFRMLLRYEGEKLVESADQIGGLRNQ